MQEDKLDTFTVLLIFIMVCILALFGVSLLIIMIRKSVEIRKLERRGFIITIISYIVTKLVICTLLLVWIVRGISDQWRNLSPSEIQLIFKNSLIAAEIAMTELFLVAFQFYISKYVCLVPRFQKYGKKLRGGFYLAEALYLIAAVTLTLVYNLSSVYYTVINIFSLIVNLLIILTFLVSFFYLNFLMTGILLSEETKEDINKIYKFVLLLLFSRFLVTAFNFMVEIQLKDGNFQGFIQLIENNQNQQIIQSLIFIGYIIYIFLTEGLPLMYSLKRSIFNMFTVIRGEKTEEEENMNQNLLEKNENSGKLVCESMYNDAFQEIVQLKQFASLQELASIKSQIWQYFRGQHKSKLYMIRKSKKSLSNYLIQDAIKEIQILNSKNIRELNPLGYFTQNETLYLYEPYRFIKVVDHCLTINNKKQKVDGVILIAQGIQKLHENNYAHGSISHANTFILPKNQFIASRVRFSGYGIQSLKRYFSFTTDYSNKNIYTAPQYLLERNSVILKPKKSGDIYSLGMILFEVMTNNTSYRELTLSELEQKMGRDKFRPKIDEKVDTQIKNLVRACWNQEAESRPKIEEVVDILRNFSAKL